MRFPIKLGIGSACALVFIVVIGFVVFPKFIKKQIKTMVSLKEGHDIREMFLKVPFALDFKIYIFNVTNPMEVQAGKMPILREMGPFCYEEWKTKVNVEDVEGDDTMLYNPVDTFIHKVWPGCLTGEEEVTIPHPMILGAVNAVIRMKPGALTLVNKAIKSIYRNPPSIFLTVKAKDLLFDGVTINCGVTDFAGKAICTQLRAEPSLKKLNDEDLAFSLLGPKNATEGKRIKAYRGVQDVHNLGRIVSFDGQPKMDVWPTVKCNLIAGTDGTIFPPFLDKEDGLVSFAADLCRSLKARYEKKAKYDGIPVGSYTADLGDMSKNPDEKCYCYTPETCLKKGLMDLFKCAGVPIYVSLPHFYNCHESYLKGVKGLSPNKKEHEIRILFERMTGSPLYAKKRLQFNMPLEPVAKVELFQNFTPTVLPLFWVEEGVELNSTWSKPLKTLFTIKKSVKIVSWMVLVASLGGLGFAGYLLFKEHVISSTPTKKVVPTNGTHISTVNGNGLDYGNNMKSAMSQVDKY